MGMRKYEPMFSKEEQRELQRIMEYRCGVSNKFVEEVFVINPTVNSSYISGSFDFTSDALVASKERMALD